MNTGGLPDITVTLEDGRDLATALENGELGDADYGLHYIGLSGTDVNDKVDGLHARRRAGVRRRRLQVAPVRRGEHRAQQDAQHDRERHERRLVPVLQPLRRHVREPRRARRAHAVAAELHAQRRRHYPRSFVQFDVHAYLDALRALDGQPILDEDGNPTGDVYDASRSLPEFNPVQSYDVDEDTIALYVKANFGRDNWFASGGVRWITTDTTARTAIDSIVFVDDPTPEIPTSSPDVTYSPADPLTQKGSYSKFLPSVNAGYWLRKDLLLRAAVARVMARPSLNQLAPTRTDNTLDRTFAVFYDGNADLEPVEADQADLSLEWYFDDKSVLSAAVFWKDIKDFITTELQENVDIGVIGNIGGAGDAPLLYDVSRPINGDKAKVLGCRVRRAAFLRQRLRLPRELHLHRHQGLRRRRARRPARGRIGVRVLGRADVRERSLGRADRGRLQRRVHRDPRRGRRALADTAIRSPGSRRPSPTRCPTASRFRSRAGTSPTSTTGNARSAGHPGRGASRPGDARSCSASPRSSEREPPWLALMRWSRCCSGACGARSPACRASTACRRR